MSDKAKIREIIERYNEFLREFENLSKVLDQLPLYKAASVLNKLINAIKALRELMNDMSPKVWEVLWDFANCKSELVQKLNKEELIQLVKTLKALAQTQLITIENKIAELEDKGQNVPAELRTQKDKLEQIINGLSERFINDLQQSDLDAARQKLVAFKENVGFKLIYALLFAQLALKHGKAILKASREIAKQSAAGAKKAVIRALIKALIVQIIKALIKQIYGKEAAAKINPHVGSILAVVEFLVIAGIIWRKNTLSDAMDDALVQLIKVLKECGFVWNAAAAAKASFSVRGAEYVNGKAFVKVMVVCASKKGDAIEFGKPCQAKFEGDATPKTKVLKLEPNGKNYWEWTTKVDMQSVLNTDCVKNGKFCLVYLDIRVANSKGEIKATGSVIIGVIVK